MFLVISIYIYTYVVYIYIVTVSIAIAIAIAAGMDVSRYSAILLETHTHLTTRMENKRHDGWKTKEKQEDSWKKKNNWTHRICTKTNKQTQTQQKQRHIILITLK